MSTKLSLTERAKKNNDLFRDTPTRLNKRLSITLPLPPSVNHMYVNTRGGGKRLTKKAETFVRQAKALVNLAIEEQHWVKGEHAIWYYVDLAFYFPDRIRRDASNCLKILLDVMEPEVYDDDRFALPRIQTVEYDKLNPRVEVLVSVQTESQREKGRRINCT